MSLNRADIYGSAADILPPDMLRGTELAKWSGLNQESLCICGHKFGIHVTYNTHNKVSKQCQFCGCAEFQESTGENQMIDTAEKMQNDGYKLAQRWVNVFSLNPNVEYKDCVALGMVFATQQGLNLENGAAFVQGFVDCIMEIKEGDVSNRRLGPATRKSAAK